ncbi:cation diffusion facilitator family transporter [Pediococcus argentinicus]|uniref:cation diffusion facilitator family transporter n=1 Tax=Pediococcus argentinicus TaxID=480391 RepID=UPI00338DA49E
MDNHNSQVTGKRFFCVTLLNLVITVAEFLGGIFSGSLALLSDAIHNLGDSAAIVMAYVANRISKRGSNHSKTFGYRRAEILASFLNALFLILISVFLMVEAIKRFSNPEPINGSLMLIVAIIGLLANFVSAGLLSKGSKNNLNIKATYLHVLSDALSSVGVIFGALMIQFFKITWVDPVVTMLVSIYIIWESIPLLKDTTNILMQAGPDLDYKTLDCDMRKVDGVVNVHHIHAWLIDENRIMFSAHINVEDRMLSEIEPIYRQLEELLKTKYHVDHVTLQAEVTRGKESPIFTNKIKDV